MRMKLPPQRMEERNLNNNDYHDFSCLKVCFPYMKNLHENYLQEMRMNSGMSGKYYQETPEK